MYWNLLVLMLLAPAAVAQTGQPLPDDLSAQATGSVEGRVTNSETGEGISGVNVRLIPLGRRRTATDVDRVTSSRADVSFMVDGVAAGTYFVLATQSNFTSGPNGPRSRPTVNVEPGQVVTNVSVQLDPIGRIQGKVVDDDGNPVPGARVQAFTMYNVRGKTQLRRVTETATDESGKYALKTQQIGKYYISAELEQDVQKPKSAHETSSHEESDLELVRTFYPKSLNIENATPLDISAGQDASDVTIQLVRAAAHHIRGKVEGLPTDGQARVPVITLGPRGSIASDGLGAVARLDKDGSFDFPKVTPGSYTLSVTGRDNSGGMQNKASFRSRLLARQDVDVGADDVNGIVLAVVPLITLSGRVTVEGLENPDLSNVHASLVPSGPGAIGGFQNVTVQHDGTFQVENLAPGEYMVRISGGPSGSYIKSVSYNQQDITGTGIDLTQGGGGEIDVILRTGTGEVDGTLESSAQLPGTTMMILVPDTLAPDGSGALFANMQTSGAFVIRNVPPGRYYAYAVERWSPVWQNPEFLHSIRNQGSSLDVPENGHLQVQLSILSTNQIESAAAPLGLTPQ